VGSAKEWRVDDANRTTYGPAPGFAPRVCPCCRWSSSPTKEEVANCAQPGGAGGNLSGSGCRGLFAVDCSSHWQGAVDSLARGGPKSRAPELPSWQRRPSCAESRSASQAGEVDDLRASAQRSHSPPRGGLVSTADFSLLEGGISRATLNAGFPRNDLPHPLPSRARRPSSGAGQAPAPTSPDSTTWQEATGNRSGKDQGHDHDQPAPS